MKRFIYVFSKADRDILLADGFVLLKTNGNNNIFVFARKEHDDIEPPLDKGKYMLSDVLTF